MTYAQLQAHMSSAELELWIALQSVRAQECPSCGREAKELMEFDSVKVRCPICKYEYHRIRTVDHGHHRGV